MATPKAPAPLALAKSDTPTNTVAKSAMLATWRGIARQFRTVKTLPAATNFWECLMAYAGRNLAEINGQGAGIANANAGPDHAMKPAAKSSSARGKAASGNLTGEALPLAPATPKRPHRATRQLATA